MPFGPCFGRVLTRFGELVEREKSVLRRTMITRRTDDRLAASICVCSLTQMYICVHVYTCAKHSADHLSSMSASVQFLRTCISAQVGNSAILGGPDGGQPDSACKGQGGAHEAGAPAPVAHAPLCPSPESLQLSQRTYLQEAGLHAVLDICGLQVRVPLPAFRCSVTQPQQDWWRHQSPAAKPGRAAGQRRQQGIALTLRILQPQPWVCCWAEAAAGCRIHSGGDGLVPAARGGHLPRVPAALGQPGLHRRAGGGAPLPVQPPVLCAPGPTYQGT